MRFSTAFLAAVLLTFSNRVSADVSTETETEGSAADVEFPFSDDAIIEAVALADDIAPIVLNDAVFFVNTTIADAELEASGLSKREADAWRWRYYALGQPIAKREAEADADAEADAWRWRYYALGQPIAKREAEADADAEAGADADAWRWRRYALGQPIAKREAEADADAEADAWRWRYYALGQPIA